METADGLIFTVKGLVHPPERLVAYLRYLPDPHGDREREGTRPAPVSPPAPSPRLGGVSARSTTGFTRYRRVYHFQEQEEILRACFPVYLYHDPMFGGRLQSVPRHLVRRVYDPRRALAALQGRGPSDPAEERTLGLTELLRAEADVPSDSLGVSGSVMLGLHRPDSDIDIVVYGKAACQDIRRALRHLLEDSAGPVRRPNEAELQALHASHRPDTPLSRADFVRLQNRKVNEGRFEGLEYFIRFVKLPTEAKERYGNPCFEPMGPATIRARVTDDQDALFTPCRYAVEEVTLLEGTPVANVREIASFRGRFSDQARAGERVTARGTLERVVPRSSPAYYRLVIGGRTGDILLAHTGPSLVREDLAPDQGPVPAPSPAEDPE